MEEFEEKMASARREDAVEMENTLREDYECFIDGEGEFFVKYAAKCGVCGFYHSYKYSENVSEK